MELHQQMVQFVMDMVSVIIIMYVHVQVKYKKLNLDDNAYGNNCEFFTCNKIFPNDTKGCNGGGSCVGPNKCACNSGLILGDLCENSSGLIILLIVLFIILIIIFILAMTIVIFVVTTIILIVIIRNNIKKTKEFSLKNKELTDKLLVKLNILKIVNK
jgi:hypothetical protein